MGIKSGFVKFLQTIVRSIALVSTSIQSNVNQLDQLIYDLDNPIPLPVSLFIAQSKVLVIFREIDIIRLDISHTIFTKQID